MSNPFDDTYYIGKTNNNNNNNIRRGTKTNPFDDDNNNNHSNINPVNQKHMQVHSNMNNPATTSSQLQPTFSNKNPFEQQQQQQNYHDDMVDRGSNRSSSFMIDHDDDDGNDERNDDDDDYNNMNHNDDSNIHDVDAPAEASWQYLGDLPYRRVPIYSNITWERRQRQQQLQQQNHNNNNNNKNEQIHHYGGLATYPPNSLRYYPKIMNPREIRQLLRNTTRTIVCGCPNGGPIAVMTVPIVVGNGSIHENNNNNTTTSSSSTSYPTGGGGGSSSSNTTNPTTSTAFMKTQINIWTNSGKFLTQIEFPPSPPIAATSSGKPISSSAAALKATTIATTTTTSPPHYKNYTAADVLIMGFTTRTTLIVVLRDSYCYTYNLQGDNVLPPFFIMPRNTQTTTTTITAPSPSTSTSPTNKSSTSRTGKDTSSTSAVTSPPTTTTTTTVVIGTDLLLATVYEGGVAVLATNKDSAIVELFDEHDDDLESYIHSAHPSIRIIVSNGGSGSSHGNTNSSSSSSSTNITTNVTGTKQTNYGIVTILPTGSFANQNFCHYCSIAVLPRYHTSTRHPELFLSTSDHSVVTIDTISFQLMDVNCRAQCKNAPIIDMCFAPNGRFLACFTEANVLTVISTSFETKILDFDTSAGSNVPPTIMQWCGEDSVVLHWKNLGVLMIGPYGDWLRFPYENVENLYIIPEVDCCRVITDWTVDVLQRVPPATALLLRIGSIEAAAMLLDAADAFYSGSPSADVAAKTIIQSGLLHEAIETCTDSALKEFDIHTQKRLLRAASYGMHFAYKNNGISPSTGDGSDYHTNHSLLLGGPITGSEYETGILPSVTTAKFVEAARTLRVLNALRNPNVGFVLTATQYDVMSPMGVVARLIAMHRPALANAISQYLQLPSAVQLYCRAAKAAALVRYEKSMNGGRSDIEIANAAIRIINGETTSLLDDSPNPNRTNIQTTAVVVAAAAAGSTTYAASMNRGSYATVALAAYRAGRPGVAKLLLAVETSVVDKVPALIATNSYEEAIVVATNARELNYIFAILMEFEKSCLGCGTETDISKAQSLFLSTVVTKFTSEAFHTLRQYLLSTYDVKSVTNLLLRAQKFLDAGETMAKRALRTDHNNDNNEDDHREQQAILTEASRIFGLGKETAFQKSCTDDYLELLKDQEVIRTKYGSPDVCPVTSSVTRTIASVIHFAADHVREQHRLFADAEKLAKKYRVPEKRLWHIKVKAYADSNQWSNLRILADSRSKPPISFKFFAQVVIRANEHQPITEILRYIEKVSVPEEKYDLYCEANQWQRALDEAMKIKDIRRILNVKTLCNSSEIAIVADQMMGRLA